MLNFHILCNLRNLNKNKKMNGNSKETNLEHNTSQKVTRVYNRIQTKLILIFFIPVILIILLGVISYQRSAEGLNKKYVNSAVTNLDMLGNYLTLGFQTIETKSNVLISDNDIKRYYSGYFEESTVDKMSTYRDIKTYIFANALSEWYIKNICIFGKYGDGITTKGSIREIKYTDFLLTDLAKKVDISKDNGIWVASHFDLDEKMGNSFDSSR